jgi:hypothetical protein
VKGAVAGCELSKSLLPLAGGFAAVFGLSVAGMAGGNGGVNGAVTVTTAVSVAVTFGPLGGLPVSVATFVKLAVTAAAVQP